MNDVLSSAVPIWGSAVASAQSYIGPGRLRPIVTSGRERSALLPDTPTVDESGYPGISAYFCNVLLAPRGTPPDIVAKLNAAVVDLYGDPATVARIRDLGHTPVADTPRGTADFIRNDIGQWTDILRDLKTD